jgi:hypothetical protein
VKARVYGLLLEFDQDVPWVQKIACHESADYKVFLQDRPAPEMALESGGEPWYVSRRSSPAGVPALVIRKHPGELYWFRFSDGVEFLVDATSQTIHAWWLSSLTLADALGYLFGAVLGFLLRSRGAVCLHGSAVAAHDRTFLLCGPEEAGKSTTAAALALRGFRVLTDDVIALDEQGTDYWVHPGPPRVHLLRPSVEALLGTGEALPRISPSWDKHALDLASSVPVAEQPLRLAAVYFLERRDATRLHPHVTPVTGAEALIQLVTNSYANRLLDREMRSREFEILTRLTTQIPIRRVVPPQGLERLDALCAGILADFRSLVGVETES